MTRVHGMMVVAAAGMLVVGAMVVAGPLNPPGGAIAPTGKTLQEIFDKPSGDGRIPIAGGTTGAVISQPGSYVLTGNITVSSVAMTISASAVTVDLNGFRLTSTLPNSSGVITIGAGLSGVVVRNGSVAGSFAAVTCGNSCVGLVLEDISVYGAKSIGIGLSGGCRGCIIRRCGIYDMGSTTTPADGNMTITAVSNLSAIGTRIEDCVVSRLVYNGTGTANIRGIAMGGSANVVTGCMVYHDAAAAGTGILGTGTVYRNNSVSNLSTAYSGGTDGGGNF